MDTWVGVRLPRRDAVAKTTGRARYVADLNVPGALAVRLLRSPFPHARLQRVDVSQAEAMPGVVAVLSRADLIGNTRWQSRFGAVLADETIVAVDKVVHVGDPIAAVAAGDVETARSAVERITVDYEPLPAVTSLDEALVSGAPLVHDEVHLPEGIFEDIRRQLSPVPGTNIFNHVQLQRGDAERGFALADVVMEDVYTSGHLQHTPIEPHGLVVIPGDGPSLHIIAPTQTPYIVRRMMAELFRIPIARVRVTVPYIGGGFGAKAYPQYEPILCALALKTGRPVRLVLDHEECWVTLNNPATRLRIRTGASKAGRIIARQCEVHWDFGAYADVGPRMARNAGLAAAGPYRIPNLRIDSYGVYTNKPNCGGFRGYGITEMAAGYEAHLDHLAAELGIDPLALRRLNLLEEGDEYATGEQMQAPAFRDLLDQAAAAVQWTEAPRTERRNAAGERVAVARGLGVIIKPTITPSSSSAAVQINEDGSVTVLVSYTEMGQGAETVSAQIAAEALGVPVDQVTVAAVDTAVTPYDQCTTSSRGTFHMGQALARAGADARRQVLALAARELEIRPEDLDLQGGIISVPGTGRRLTLDHLMRTPGGRLQGIITGHGFFDTRDELRAPFRDGWRTPSSAFWCSAAAGAEVEVNLESGEVRVRHCVGVEEVGKAINPLCVEQQICGSAIAAQGHVLFEQVEFVGGQPVNAGLGQYHIPCLTDIPDRLEVRIREHPHPHGPYGAKGAGESCVPAVTAALFTAVTRAVGAPVAHMPMRPEDIVRAAAMAPEAR